MLTPPIRVHASVNLANYVSDLRDFIGDSSALENGIAFTDRAGGNLSRPFFPDGLAGNANGPFSKPVGKWSVFSTGLQLDLVINGILQHVLAPDGSEKNCAGMALGEDLASLPTRRNLRLANGMQIFPGSVPIYSGNRLLGGVGVSGDGVDQDDMIAFLGLHEAGLVLDGAIGNAPPQFRADRLRPQGIRLRYVQCPQAPFIDSDDDNVCDGK